MASHGAVAPFGPQGRIHGAGRHGLGTAFPKRTSGGRQAQVRRLAREPGGVGGTDMQQRLGRIPDAPDDEEDAPAVEAAEQALFHRALEMIRCEFEERTWQAFWRTAVEGRPAADVGEELGMRPGAVRVAKSRVLQRLREELGDLFS